MTSYPASEERKRRALQGLQQQAARSQETMQSVIDSISAGPKWVLCRLRHADFYQPGSVSSSTVAICTLGPGTILHQYVVKHNQSFKGGAISAATVVLLQPSDRTVGGSSTAVGSVKLGTFVGAFDVYAAPSNDPTAGGFVRGIPECHIDFSTPAELKLTLATTGGYVSALTQGQVDVRLLVSRPVFDDAQRFTIGSPTGWDGLASGLPIGGP